MRSNRMDNIRCLLIFLVVFGHFLALIPGAGADTLYRIIYLFHMPAFLFLTGYFSRFHFSKILTDLVYPYILFQILYLLFDALVLQGGPMEKMHLQFAIPYWLLWYLLDITFYRLLLPLFDKVPPRLRPLAVLAAVALALVCGYVPEFGYYLTTGRFFSFLPFFLAGYYLSRSGWFPHCLNWPWKKKWPFTLAGVLIALWSMLRESRFTAEMLYGSVPYPVAGGGFGPEERLLLTGIAFGWILALLTLVPERPIPAVTVRGGNTLPVFLLHGFAVKLAGAWRLFRLSPGGNLMLALALSASLVWLLGSPGLRKPFRLVCTGGWLERLWRKYVL